jgi:hypothetical protein
MQIPHAFMIFLPPRGKGNELGWLLLQDAGRTQENGEDVSELEFKDFQLNIQLDI